ncbi:hypothetical protein [Poseidonocella sp. HB161398]|nr:hypothetical protein [Poseidonocella sp. HB161398]
MSQGTTYSQHLARLLRDYEALVVDLGFLREFRSRAYLLGAD